MSDWCASQLPEIARRVLAEEQAGRPVDPHRKAWAEQVLALSAGAPPEQCASSETADGPMEINP